jgi:hypothetical protein
MEMSFPAKGRRVCQTFRRDGFASMDADEKGGTLTTRPVRFSGRHLFVTMDNPRGELRVQVLDPAGQVIMPFMIKNCRLYVFWVSPEASGVSHVAQTSSLLYRGFPICRRSFSPARRGHCCSDLRERVLDSEAASSKQFLDIERKRQRTSALQTLGRIRSGIAHTKRLGRPLYWLPAEAGIAGAQVHFHTTPEDQLRNASRGKKFVSRCGSMSWTQNGLFRNIACFVDSELRRRHPNSMRRAGNNSQLTPQRPLAISFQFFSTNN